MPEIEAKFLLERPEQLKEVLDTLTRLGHSVERGPTQSIVDRYYDTSDWLVLRAGWACRMRRNGDDRTLTLKALASGDGPVFEREEIEQALTLDEASRELPPGPVQAKLEPIVNGHPRHELFSLTNERTLYVVTKSGEHPVRLELSVDRAQVASDQADRPPVSFVELELELKEGGKKTLKEIARLLRKRVGLVSAQLSKFDRGLRAAGIERPLGLDSRPISNLRRDSSMLDLAYAHLSRQLECLKLQQMHAWEGIDPEGVHQMRITIRRLRGALRVFRPLLSTTNALRFNDEFRWLGKALGAVRDADVYNENFRSHVSTLPDSDAETLEAYQAHLVRVQRTSRDRLLEVLESDRYRRLVADFERFVARGPSAGRWRRCGAASIGLGAEAYIHPALQKMRRRGRRIGAESPDSELHRLRIRAKRARYLMEFFAGFYDGKLKRRLKACKKLQTVLGQHQDAVVACNRLRAYGDSLDGQGTALERRALERLVKRQTRQARAARKKFPQAWSRFEGSIRDL